MNLLLIEIGRIGIGILFIALIILDFKTRPLLFQLMAQRKLPFPTCFFIGAITWKAITALGLIFNFYPSSMALLLALYIFIANFIFNNFWAQPKERRDFSSYLFLVYLCLCFGLLVVAGASR